MCFLGGGGREQHTVSTDLGFGKKKRRGNPGPWKVSVGSGLPSLHRPPALPTPGASQKASLRNPWQPSTKDVHAMRQVHAVVTPVRPTSAPPPSSPPGGSSLWDPENETGVSGAVTEAGGGGCLRAHPNQSSAFNATSRLTPRWKRF